LSLMSLALSQTSRRSAANAGIHELSETECLAVFQVIQLAIIEILEDEKKAVEKEERRKMIARELEAFSSPQTPQKR
jgi:hypothetical protein